MTGHLASGDSAEGKAERLTYLTLLAMSEPAVFQLKDYNWFHLWIQSRNVATVKVASRRAAVVFHNLKAVQRERLAHLTLRYLLTLTAIIDPVNWTLFLNDSNSEFRADMKRMNILPTRWLPTLYITSPISNTKHEYLQKDTVF